MPWASSAAGEWTAVGEVRHVVDDVHDTHIGIDMGGTKVLGVVMANGEVVAQLVAQTPRRRDRVIPVLRDLVAELAGLTGRSGGATIDGISGIGLGVPGFIDSDGVARRAPNLPAIVGLDIAGGLGAAVGLTVRVDNDANCAVRAAAEHDAPGVPDLILVTFGTGIGAGFIVGGVPVRGANGFAAEPGHMIIDVDGLLCVCGQRGCWETLASGSAIGHAARRIVEHGGGQRLLDAAGGDLDAVDGRLVARLAAEGDDDAVTVLDEHARWVAVGLVNLVNLLDPSVIVLGGGVVAQGEPFRERVIREMERAPTMREGRRVDVRISSFGPAAGAVGAALLSRAASST